MELVVLPITAGVLCLLLLVLLISIITVRVSQGCIILSMRLIIVLCGLHRCVGARRLQSGPETVI